MLYRTTINIYTEDEPKDETDLSEFLDALTNEDAILTSSIVTEVRKPKTEDDDEAFDFFDGKR